MLLQAPSLQALCPEPEPGKVPPALALALRRHLAIVSYIGIRLLRFRVSGFSV